MFWPNFAYRNNSIAVKRELRNVQKAVVTRILRKEVLGDICRLESA